MAWRRLLNIPGVLTGMSAACTSAYLAGFAEVSLLLVDPVKRSSASAT